jgi:hypothetical protein
VKTLDFDTALGKLDDNSEMIRGYWKDLRDSWRASEDALRRTLFYILVLAAVFMLLQDKAIGNVTFAGLGITNLRLVTTFIPVIISYLIYVSSTNAAIAYRLGTIHDELASHYWPKFYHADLEVTVRPTGSFGESELITLANDNIILSNMSAWAGAGRFLISIFAPIAFEVYALVKVFAQPKAILWLDCLVAIFSFLTFVSCVPNLVFVIKQLGEDIYG